ncbi:hypothetical protein [Pelagicoccus sp. SDUM812002]|uniref:hypothetical protein n=1 Tax=Pelagicoccus sp. SDUM812002 TaxID=3041266 RepID=UPI00280C41B5|nr:hypothetical protein [Pelagicoccus sp. SDUM812002]MDQ8184284.1 hypothetical protein [Pelagicoccus sp. SDUM812002]
MAQLTQPQSNSFEVGEVAPAGTFIATCLEVLDQFGVERPKFENPNEMEKLDVTRFLFGFKGQDGNLYKVQSYEFRISGSPKSNLYKFLSAWLGHPPAYGWDYCELKGQGGMISVAQKQSRDGTRTFASLNSISPVIEQLKNQVLPLEVFEANQAPQAPVSAPQAQLVNVPAAHIPANAPVPFPQQYNAQPPAPTRAAPQPVQPQAPQQGGVGSWDPSNDPNGNNCPF